LAINIWEYAKANLKIALPDLFV